MSIGLAGACLGLTLVIRAIFAKSVPADESWMVLLVGTNPVAIV
jgi:hypothetical protein